MIIRHSVFSQNTRLIYLCDKSTAISYDTDDKRKTCASRRQTSTLDLLRRRQVNSKQAALKKGSSIEYVWINLAAPRQ